MKASKIIFYIIFVVLVLSILFVGDCGYSQIVDGTKDDAYRILNYDITIDVDEYRNMVVTEKMEVEFDVSSAGITRRIPLRNYVQRQDGTTDYNNAKVENFNILYNGSSENRIYHTGVSNGYYIVDLGYDERTYQNIHNYYFQYDYIIGSDTAKDYDEFYFNIIGTEWDCEIHNVTFEVNLPKDFEVDFDSNVGATYGEYGSTSALGSYKGEIYAEKFNDGIKISGSIDFLDAFEGLTLRAQMEDGYFVYVMNYTQLYYFIGIVVLALILIAIAYFMWRKYGKDYEIVSPVTFYPPRGLDVVDIELNYKEKVSTKSIVGMIVTLANKGYIKIEEVEGKKCYNLIKIKEYDQDNDKEKKLMQSLFTRKETVSSAKLGDVLENYTESFFTEQNNPIGKKQVIEKESKKKAKLMTIPMAIMLIATFVMPLIYVGNFDFIIVVSIVSIEFAVIPAILLNLNNIKAVILIEILGLVVGISFIYNYGVFNISWLLAYMIIGGIAYIVLAIFMVLMKRRTKESAAIYGEILAFKDFLENVEKEKLDALVMDDPEYFYNILPYTYVLDISDKWIEKLDYIHIENPQWLVSSGSALDFHVSMTLLNSSFKNMNNSLNTAHMRSVSNKISSTIRSSGGGRSGGGFSGGGSGGGGGGRR